MSAVLSPPFLFHFSVPLRYRAKIWSDKPLAFGEEYRLQSFGHLEGRRQFADIRAAWNERGIAFSVNVTGKRQAAWCRESRAVESDGVQIWLDTRATNNVHRATKFCHRYVFLPTGGGHSLREPAADQLLINRARENAKPIRPGELRIRSQMKADGYFLEFCVPATALTGYDPSEYDRVGFYYAVMDRELGWQNFSVGNQFPFDEDPSTWGVCELVRD
ncbi:hypothetical protein M4951_23915 [Blastopirellula sp. J2-11]|uniref:sugar-binding protein n=1 Tax=Blastopirellula sp. J2-11 TaxID=2943192 RepID=UPI0021C90B89|nr:sugar-binding protein [Blastopirellula sp. J2-11]UUO06380.1 hypothetical protein M4951_23915 [Blastopirellula sp. J2-11]